MCGIAGIIHPSEGVARAAVRRMNDAQAHRGPDGDGAWSVPFGGRALALGHRRLAIQDVSAAGLQPMTNPETGDVIVYNGELYNVNELRAALERDAGATFRSRSDTEVLLGAFARWGIGCLERLYGMFAFALYAARERTLYLARDPLGIKPLYVGSASDGALVFASEVRAVLASGLVDPRVDPVGLGSLLAYGAVASPRTMVEGVRLLEPGTWAAVSSHASTRAPLASKRFWTFAAEPKIERSVTAAADRIRPALRDAIASHLVSDVPVAVFLSGGIDSTVIAAVAAEARGGDIDTFTVRLGEDRALDEAPVARRTAAAFGARHHDVTLGSDDALALATSWLGSLDQPSVDGLNTYVIARAARERGIVVALSGIGGDEMFGGYSTFRDVPVIACAANAVRAVGGDRRVPRALAARLAARWTGATTRGEKLRDLIDASLGGAGGEARSVAASVASVASAASIALARRRLLSNTQMAELGLTSGASAAFLPPEADVSYGVPSKSAWAGVRAVETRFYMGNMLLRDADVFGMAHGLEIRVPLLDRRVVDAALTMARPSLSLRRGPNKPWLVGALEGRVPGEVAGRAKSGFSLPQARWMRGPLRDLFEARVDTVARSGYLDQVGVRRIWQRFLNEPEGASWSRAWLVGALGEWLDRASRQPPSRATAGSPEDAPARP